MLFKKKQQQEASTETIKDCIAEKWAPAKHAHFKISHCPYKSG